MLRSFIKMRQKFSTKWKSSVQPRKQRKYLHNSPLHIKQKSMGACLDKSLRTKYQIRTVEVRKGDEVKIMRGKFKKKIGKVLESDRKKTRISIEGLNVTKKDGNKVKAWVHPSKVKIVKLNEDDKKRFKQKMENKNAQKTN